MIVEYGCWNEGYFWGNLFHLLEFWHTLYGVGGGKLTSVVMGIVHNLYLICALFIMKSYWCTPEWWLWIILILAELWIFYLNRDKFLVRKSSDQEAHFVHLPWAKTMLEVLFHITDMITKSKIMLLVKTWISTVHIHNH